MQESDSDHMRDSHSPMPHSSLRAPNQGTSSKQKKHASFAEHVIEMPQKKSTFVLASSNEDAIASDDEDAIDDDLSESAIDDEDWEDDEEEPAAPQPLTFDRVDSSMKLTSRRSILTDNLHQGQRANAMQNAASRSTPMLQNLRRSSRNGPSMPVSPEEEGPEIAMEASNGDSSAPIPMGRSNINMTSSAPLALSPRATRRSMLHKELGASLRKHMLNERQQRNIIPVAPTAIPRRHTTQDIKNLTKYPEATSTDQTPAASGPNGAKKDYFQTGFAEYHQKGW